VTIEIPAIGYKKEMMVAGGTVKNVKLDPQAQILSSEVVEVDMGVHVTSDRTISVYGLNRRFQTTDTYLGLPMKVLGSEYRVMGYSLSNVLVSEFAIVATEDNTVVKITPRVETKQGRQANSAFKVTLNAGDVYQVASKYNPRSRRKCDLTGSHIVANKKIAVFSGHQCSYVPERVHACNHLVEQLPPVQSWGKHFYIGKMESRSNYTYRVLAHHEGTRVFENNKLIGEIGPGEFIERRPESRIQVSASMPVLTAQYSHGFKNGDSIGDPMMLLISPTQQFLKKYRFATPINGEWKHYINIVVPTESIESMRLDQESLDEEIFERIGLSRYSIAYIEVPFGTHVIEADRPFGMYSYGFGFGEDAFDAYGTMGGQSFFEYIPAEDTLAPSAEEFIDGENIEMIIRDDRVDDSGIERIEIISQENMNVEIPFYERGVQQIKITADPEISADMGKALILAEDMAGNQAFYTICNVYNIELDQYLLQFNRGKDVNCASEGLNSIGAFGGIGFTSHNADFSQSGNVSAPGLFGDAFGTGGWGGLYYGRRLSIDWQISGRLSFNTYGGTLSAPDSVISHTYSHVDSAIVPYQEARRLGLDGVFMHLDFAAEYYIRNFFYLTGGINFSISLSDAITFKKQILIPQDYVFENGSREITEPGAPAKLESLSTINFGLFGGVGVNYAINYRLNAFAEAKQIYYPGNIVSEGNWSISRLEIIAGIKYKF
jgi:hypothetical protein